MKKHGLMKAIATVEKTVREWYADNGFPHELPRVKYIAVPLGEDDLGYHINRTGTDGAYITPMLRKAKKDAIDKYRHLFSTPELAEELAKAENDDVEFSDAGVRPEFEKYGTGTIIVNADIDSVLIWRMLMHEMYHAWQAACGLSRKYPAVIEGAAHYINNCAEDVSLNETKINMLARDAPTGALLGDLNAYRYAYSMLDQMPVAERLKALGNEDFYRDMSAETYYRFFECQVKRLLGEKTDLDIIEEFGRKIRQYVDRDALAELVARLKD